MKGIDTNVLLRYLVRDDPQQARIADAFLINECSAQDPGFINRVVLCETVWVLESGYHYSRSQVARAIEGLLRAAQFQIEDRTEAWMALREYYAGSDFADALIAAVNLRNGCQHTVTFDRKAAGRRGFVAIQAERRN